MYPLTQVSIIVQATIIYVLLSPQLAPEAHIAILPMPLCMLIGSQKMIIALRDYIQKLSFSLKRLIHSPDYVQI